MGQLKKLISVAALCVLIICVYSFLLGNGVFAGNFENEPLAWYFLAKGIFCSLALILLVRILESLQ